MPKDATLSPIQLFLAQSQSDAVSAKLRRLVHSELICFWQQQFNGSGGAPNAKTRAAFAKHLGVTSKTLRHYLNGVDPRRGQGGRLNPQESAILLCRLGYPTDYLQLSRAEIVAQFIRNKHLRLRGQPVLSQNGVSTIRKFAEDALKADLQSEEEQYDWVMTRNRETPQKYLADGIPTDQVFGLASDLAELLHSNPEYRLFRSVLDEFVSATCTHPFVTYATRDESGQPTFGVAHFCGKPTIEGNRVESGYSNDVGEYRQSTVIRNESAEFRLQPKHGHDDFYDSSSVSIDGLLSGRITWTGRSRGGVMISAMSWFHQEAPLSQHNARQLFGAPENHVEQFSA